MKRTLETMGLHRVQTYIQSGNVLFESEENPETLRLRIEEEIRAAFGISITVVLMTAEELERITTACLHADISLAEGESIHVSVLTETPPQKVVELSASERDNDEYHIH